MMGSFAVSEEEWLKVLIDLAPLSKPRTLWVSVDTNIFRLLCTPFQVVADERVLYLRLPPLSPDDSPLTEILVYLPNGGASYEKRTNEKGDVRLEMTYLLRAEGAFPFPAKVVLSTSEEFLVLEDSEVQIQ